MSAMESVDRMMRINGRINAAMVEGLHLSDWDLTDRWGGESIRVQLAHMAHFRYGWLKAWASDLLGSARPGFHENPDGSLDVAFNDAQSLLALFRDGDKAALHAVKWIKYGDRVLKGFRHPEMILARTLAYDASYRSLIMRNLGINGIERPEVSYALYGFWDFENDASLLPEELALNDLVHGQLAILLNGVSVRLYIVDDRTPDYGTLELVKKFVHFIMSEEGNLRNDITTRLVSEGERKLLEAYCTYSSRFTESADYASRVQLVWIDLNQDDSFSLEYECRALFGNWRLVGYFDSSGRLDDISFPH